MLPDNVPQGNVPSMLDQRYLCSLLLCVILACLGSPARADLVVFSNEQEMNGPDVIVEDLQGDTIILLLHGAKLERHMSVIQSFKIDVEPRIKKATNSKDLLKLARVCKAANQPKAVAKAYKAALDTPPPIEDEELLSIAKFLEKQEALRAAANAYRQFVARHPDRKDIEEHANKLYEQAPPEMPTTSVPKPTTVAIAKRTPIVPIKRAEGLEAKGPWVIEQWGNAGSTRIVASKTEEDENKVLEISFTGTDKHKTAARRKEHHDLSRKVEMTFRAALDLDIGRPRIIKIALAFYTLPGSVFYESKQFSLKPNGEWVPISVDLSASDFKSEASNWQHTSPLENRDKVEKILILVYNYNKAPGVVYVDDLYFKSTDEVTDQGQ